MSVVSGDSAQTPIRHLYLSPHPDDAILSCGGLIHRQRTAGESVAVMTLCAGFSENETLSPLAQRFHPEGENPRDLMIRRRTEDQAVLAKTGVIPHYCQVPDGLYRLLDGKIAYPDMASLYGEPHPQEQVTLLKVWRHELKGMRPHPNQATVYAPLAVGNHIDHQLARDLAWQLRKDGWQVWYYEDYPYAEEPGKLQLALNQFGSVAWKARIVPIDVTAKIAAIRGYATQVALLFGDEHAMVTRVKRFTADVACDNSLRERIRRKLAGSGGRRERLWRAVWGFHAHAERIWTSDADGLANVQERREL